MDHLALQVGEIDRIGVDHPQPPDASRRQILQHRRTQPARADNEDRGRQQLLLPDATDFGQQDMAGVTLQLVVGPVGHRFDTLSRINEGSLL